MKKRQYVFMALSMGLIAFSSCGDSSGSAQNGSVSEAVKGAWEVDSVLKNGEVWRDREIVIEGVCTHICKHGGRKIFLMGSDDEQTIRIDAAPSLGRFSSQAVHSVVRVHGRLVEQRIDEAYLHDWMAKIKQSEHITEGVVCENESKARGENGNDSTYERIENFRRRIAERSSKEGKNYLSFFSLTADSYEIL